MSLASLNNNWAGGSAAAFAGLSATILAFKFVFRGDLVADLFAFQSCDALTVTAGTGLKLTANIGANAGPTNARFAVFIPGGDSAFVDIPLSSFSPTATYVWYGHVRPSGSPTICSEVFEDDGTSLGLGQITYGVTIQTGGGALGFLSSGTPFQRVVGEVERFAFYSAVLSGADRYSIPAPGDANLATLHPFNETSGNTAAATVGNPITLAGTEEVDFEWISSGPTPPNAPAALAVAIASGSVDLSWTDNSTDELGFEVERRTGLTGSEGPWAQIGTDNAAGDTTFSDTTALIGNRYQYRVRATNVAGDSTYSNIVTVDFTGSTPSGTGSRGSPFTSRRIG